MGEALLRTYLNEVGEFYKKGIATEHTYRGTLRNLLEKLETGVLATNEPKRIRCGAPDYVVERNNLTIGYIEAKDIGISLDKVERNEQLKRYLRALDNLILTDYLEFRWYVQGEKRMSAKIGSIRNKKIILEKDGVKLGEELLHCFLEHRGEPIRKPQELAKRMARIAHLIHDIIVDAFREKVVSDTIQDLYAVFQELLLPDLTESAFADMFAQTIAYGLFAARYNHKGNKPFRREDAAKEIPRTNPFLRKLFGTIAGPDLDDEPFVGFVDELAQILAFTDMEAVLADFGKRTRQEDPIVHFYETFLAQYDPKLREMRGVYYTPEPVVSYIVRSVDYLLREHFDCPDGLADTATTLYTSVDKNGKEHVERTPRVLILDPATGTGTFLYSVIEHIRETYRQMGNAGMWSGYVREHLLPRLFGFELLIAPYAMAHLKLGMQLAALDLPEPERKTWAYDFKTDERLGIYLTNTLDEALKRSDIMFGRYISDEANEAAKVKQNHPVMVILGNPPYSGHSANKGQWINDLLHGKDSQTGKLTGNYFEVDGQPLGERNPKWLNDDYVKFIRLAQWRIEKTGYGILAFITNHGYLDNPTFRGMRQSLMQTFDDIYILDLHGNSKKKECSPDKSKDENAFDIQQGVAIGIFVKRQKKNVSMPHLANIYHAHLWGPREIYEKTDKGQRVIGGKYHWLSEHNIKTTEWTKTVPNSPLYLFTPRDESLQTEYEQGWKVADIFPKTLLGPNSHRDNFAIAFTYDEAYQRLKDLANLSLPDEYLREKYALTDNRDWSLSRARKQKLENISPVKCIYRPFDFRYMLYGSFAFDYHRPEINDHMLKKNIAIISTKQTKENFSVLVTALPAGQHKLATPYDGSYLSPLYLYTEKSLFERDNDDSAHLNISEKFIVAFTKKLSMQFISDNKGDLQQTFGPEDIFTYMYAIFHSPTYRERYAEFLKIDFPRLPLTTNPNLFRLLCPLGERLVKLHLMEQYSQITTKYPVNGNHLIEQIKYTQPSNVPEQSRVWINKTQYFEGIPPEVWEFHIGGYQVCHKWLKDRKGRQLSFDDIRHYQRIVAALAETITLMEQIDEVIDEHGGWPIE